MGRRMTACIAVAFEAILPGSVYARTG